MASSAPPSPSETESDLSATMATVRVSFEAPKGPPPAEAEESGAPQKGSRVKMRPELDGLTETLTLKIFAELDLPSLAAVKGVSRRLGRIARDPSLLRRVTSVCWESDGTVQTNCRQLGMWQIKVRRGGNQPMETFLGLLEWLLEGGAVLVSLDLKVKTKILVQVEACRLPALLTKHSVRLKALGFRPDTPGLPGCLLDHLLTFVRSQPGLDRLRLTGIAPSLASELAQHGPNIRHLDLTGLTYWNGSTVALAPQLRSLVVAYGGLLALQDDVSGGKLLFHAAKRVHNVAEGNIISAQVMAFAVEDFRREERGSLFLDSGELGDAWDGAKHHIPQPTDDTEKIVSFLKATLLTRS